MGGIIAILPIAMSIFLYLKYGREESFAELNTLPDYIRDISEIGELSPSEAAILLNPGVMESVSKGVNPGLNKIISAEIMEMIRLGYLETIEKEIITTPILNLKKKIIAFKPVPGKDVSKLTPIQRKIYEFMRTNMIGESFSFEEYEKKLEEIPFDINLETLRQQYLKKQNFKNFYLGSKSIVDNLLNERYLDKTGFNLAKKFSIFYLTILVLLIVLGLVLNTKNFLLSCAFSLFIVIILFAFSQIKKDILSRWTKEGRLTHEKLKKYKKFMEDLTLMKEKTITDIILWEKLLVYATAFGVADKVVNAMKIHYPDYSKTKSLVHLSALSHSLPSSTSNAAGKAIGRSKGGFGGGRGGGGGSGGAR
jgi:uncharacterized membrane protein